MDNKKALAENQNCNLIGVARVKSTSFYPGRFILQFGN